MIVERISMTHSHTLLNLIFSLKIPLAVSATDYQSFTIGTELEMKILVHFDILSVGMSRCRCVATPRHTLHYLDLHRGSRTAYFHIFF